MDNAERQRRFSASQRFQILLGNSTDGLAHCDVCDEVIAILSEDGTWLKQRPIDFDHRLAFAMGGETSVENGRALCGHPRDCHKIKSAEDEKRLHKSIRQGGGPGSQTFRRAQRKAKGERSLIPAHVNSWEKR